MVTLTELIGQLVGTWIPESHPEVRIQMLIWQTAGFLLVTAYSTILAARLANPEYETRCLKYSFEFKDKVLILLKYL